MGYRFIAEISMSEPQKALLDFLEQLRRERVELEVLIRGVEKRLGILSDKAPNDPTSNPKVTVSIEDIPVGYFHNLSQADAAEKLLKLNPGHPLSTPEIVDTLRKSGVTLASKNAMTIMYTTLKRNSKFERIADKAWGLTEWYPEKRKRKDSEDEFETVP
jgi:hypothetical protein